MLITDQPPPESTPVLLSVQIEGQTVLIDGYRISDTYYITREGDDIALASPPAEWFEKPTE